MRGDLRKFLQFAVLYLLLRKLQFSLALFAWFCATGAQWDFLQVLAWGRMFAAYSQAMEFSKAAEETFNGEMCEMCKAVARGRQTQEKESPEPRSGKGKFVLAIQVVELLYLGLPDRDVRTIQLREGRSAPKTEPPTPPPRLH